MDCSQIEKKLKLKFNDKNLLIKAFIHRSYLNEHLKENLTSNERLEFLGDAILQFLTSIFLYRKFPRFPEGKLTDLRSKLVCDRSLAKIAKRLQLGEHLLLSQGEKEGGGRKNLSLLADTFEALLGAIYLDQGLGAAKNFLSINLFPTLKEAKNYQDYKSNFQKEAQKKLKITPIYKVLKEIGPDHARIFTIGVYLKNKLWGRGVGRNKQNAEQKAAKNGLEKIKAN